MSWLFGIILGLLIASPAAALPTINFDQGAGAGQAGGSLSYDGEGGPLVGTNIGFGVLAGFGTALNTGVPLFCVPACTLAFETGANTTEAVPLGGGVQQWTWAGDGGFFVLEGDLNTQADGLGVEIASGTLLTGEFTGAVGLVGPEGRLLVAGAGVDEKIGSLLEFYAIPEFLNFNFAQTEIVASGLVVGANGSLNGSVTNADLTNQQIPEPATMALFGSGLAGLAIWRTWRRR
jgi:PEP-CTERM motif